jgi:4-amino-4-deoxy-L-arabinose transferase-like glycosyltransferase
MLMALGAGLRLALATADYRSLTALVYEDDSFYYLEIARNLAGGRGLSFDGATPTNGFQPLWLLLLVPLVWLSGSDPVAPIHASALLLTAFATGSSALVFASTRRLAGPRAALLALALFAASPYFVFKSVNGLDTGLAIFFALALLHAYVCWLRDERDLPPRRALAFGALAGLALLARIDLALLLAALGLDWLAAMARRGALRRELPRALLAGALALAVWLAWGIPSRLHTGAWLPASGAASREIALHYGWSLLQPVWRGDAAEVLFDPGRAPARFWADVATSQVFVFLFEQPLLAPLRANVPFGVWPDLAAYVPLRAFARAPVLGTLALLAALAACAALLRRGSGRLGRLVGAYLLLTFAGYVFYAPVYWYYARYLAVPVLVTLVYALSAASAPAAAAWRRGGLPRTLCAAALSLVVVCQIASWRSLPSLGLHWRESEPTGFLRAWQTLEPRIDETRRIGAFQAGIYAWFSGLDIVNLDGKVNPDAQRALARRRLHRYLVEQRIDYVLDWDWVLHSLCARHVPQGEVAFRLIAREEQPGGVSLYRVVPRARRRAR